MALQNTRLTGSHLCLQLLLWLSLISTGPVHSQSCGGDDSDCASVIDRSFSNAEWNATNYLLEQLPTVADLDGCCAACSANPICLLFDFDEETQICNLYAYTFFAESADAAGAIVPAPGKVASFLKTKTLKGRTLYGSRLGDAVPSQIQVDGNFLINQTTKDANWCAQQCITLCRCKFWSWDPSKLNDGAYDCNLYDVSAKPGAQIDSRSTAGITVSALTTAPSSNSTVLAYVLEDPAPREWNQAFYNDQPFEVELPAVDYRLPWEWRVTSAGIAGSFIWYFPWGLAGAALTDNENNTIYEVSLYDRLEIKLSTEVVSVPLSGALTRPAYLFNGTTIPLPPHETHNYNLQLPSVTTVHMDLLVVLGFSECNQQIPGVELSIEELGALPLSEVLTSKSDVYPLLGCLGLSDTVVEVIGTLTLRDAILVAGIDALQNDEIPDAMVGYAFPQSLEGECVASTDGWEYCQQSCAERPDCVGWTWLAQSVACPWSPRCEYQNRLGSGSSAASPTEGAVAGTRLFNKAGLGKCSAVVGIELIPGLSDDAGIIPATSSQRCCELCMNSTACSGYNFFQSDQRNGCQMLTGQMAGAKSAAGTVSAIKNDFVINQPAIALSQDSLLQQFDALSLRSLWTDICCFNNLPDCTSLNQSQPLLLPRIKQTVNATCDAITNKLGPVAMTKHGCACSMDDFHPSVGGLRVSGACASGQRWGGTDSRPLCAISKDVDCPLLKAGTATDECDDGEAHKGCMLVPGMELTGSFSAIVAGGSTLVASHKECCQLCSVVSDCKAFTFVKVSGRCSLLSDVDGATSAASTSDVDGVVSGLTMNQTEWLAAFVPQGSSIKDSWPNVAIGRRRRLLSVSSELDSATWQEVCCFNNLTKEACIEIARDATLVVPLSDVPSECPATESGSSNHTAAITIGVAFGCAIVALLVAGLLGLFALSRWRRSKKARVQHALNQEALLEKSNLDVDTLPPSILASPIITGGEYKWYRCYDGHNSVVLLGKQTSKNRDVAAKFFKDTHAFMRESEFNQAARNKDCMPEFLSVCDPSSPGALPCILMEAGSYSLTTHVIQSARRPSAQHCKAILYDLCEALDGLHKNGIVHFDVKPDNVLWFSESHRWKLTDFGSWSVVGERHTPQFSLRYAAPEVVTTAYNDEKVVVKQASDMWSVGVLGWEIFTGEPLFGDQYLDDDVREMLVGSRKLPFEAKPNMWEAVTEQQTRRMLEGLLCRDPSQRWSAEQVLNSAVFKAGLTEASELAEYAAVGKQVTDIHAKIRTLKEVSLQTFKAATGQALLLSFEFEEVKTTEEGVKGGGYNPPPKMYSGTMTGTLDDEDDIHTYLSPAMSSRPFLLNSMRSTDFVDLDAKIMKGQVDTVEAPLSLGAVFGMDPVFLMHQGSLYVLRVELKFGEEQLMELPVSSVEQVSLSYGDDDDEDEEGGDVVTFEVQHDPIRSDKYQWCGFAVWATDDVPLGRRSLNFVVTCRLKDNASETIEISKQCTFDFQKAGSSFTVEATAQQLQRYWDEAPGWVKLGVKGVSCLYSLSGMGG